MDAWNLAEVAVEPHRPVILRSDDGAARVIALRLPAGESLQDHEVHEHAWVHVHSGAVEVSAGAETRTVSSGGLLHFDPQERHEVRGREESLLLLLLAPWPGPGHPSLGAGD